MVWAVVPLPKGFTYHLCVPSGLEQAGGPWNLIPGLFESPTIPRGKPHRSSRSRDTAFHCGLWPPARSYSHLQVPALALGVEIAPASSILVRHHRLWQATQHSDHIVMDGASCIIGLQEPWAVFHTKNNSTQSDSDLKASAAPSYGSVD